MALRNNFFKDPKDRKNDHVENQVVMMTLEEKDKKKSPEKEEERRVLVMDNFHQKPDDGENHVVDEIFGDGIEVVKTVKNKDKGKPKLKIHQISKLKIKARKKKAKMSPLTRKFIGQ